MTTNNKVLLVAGDAIARYGFPDGHAFGTDRHEVFMSELRKAHLESYLLHASPRPATTDELLLFHTPAHVQRVMELSKTGQGLIDNGDTPAYKGVFEAASNVVGATLTAVEQIMAGKVKRAFIPIAGLHHAARDRAAGFCVFNDIGVAIEVLRKQYGVKRIAYVDIDAHHGDGVFYAFNHDPDLMFADTHEDGHFLYPGTGSVDETGEGEAVGTKLNIPLPIGAGDAEFMQAWSKIEEYLQAIPPDFVFLQCGVDSMMDDPLTHLRFTDDAHGHAARRLCQLAESWGHGRILATGGGGYNRGNVARGWTRVVREMCLT
ncbi:MAG TPA: acetoin utilization protein AcuC [Steroidobacteraceae bacterium]|nr:acetoin utilization protein AcuC [Steroidobacteraceae bacterium]